MPRPSQPVPSGRGAQRRLSHRSRRSVADFRLAQPGTVDQRSGAPRRQDFIPLVEDIVCAGKTPTELARIIEERLAKYVTNPNVTVTVSGFAASLDQQIRILGEATTPKSVPYKADMTVLDAMIEVGGLTRFASGNRATLVRTVNGRQTETRLKLDDLIKDGDISANVPLKPGDIIIIPQSFF